MKEYIVSKLVNNHSMAYLVANHNIHVRHATESLRKEQVKELKGTLNHQYKLAYSQIKTQTSGRQTDFQKSFLEGDREYILTEGMFAACRLYVCPYSFR